MCNSENSLHIKRMEKAIKEAVKSEKEGEVPVGAAIFTKHGEFLASSGNHTIKNNDPSAHAEIVAIRKACQSVKNYRLLNSVLYVTIEPCVMCMGAIIHARIDKVFFGASDPKWGAAGSLYDFASDLRLNHRVEVVGGISEKRCRELIQNFFKAKRIRRKACQIL